MAQGRNLEINWKAPLREFPNAGALRVHRSPRELRPRDTVPPPDRFDDPDGDYRVRYLATTLIGCLLEVMDQFRSDPDADAGLQAITGIEGVDILEDEPAGLVPHQWLAKQLIARATIDGVPQPAIFVDVNNDDLLAALDAQPNVRQILESDEVREALGDWARLDQGTIRLVGKVGRELSQRVSREIHDAPIEPTGVLYLTRLGTDEECWAVFDDRVELDWEDEGNLDPEVREHLEAVQYVAHRYGLVLPGGWR